MISTVAMQVRPTQLLSFQRVSNRGGTGHQQYQQLTQPSPRLEPTTTPLHAARFFL